MKIPFSKYHGAGNDFVIIDNRSPNFTPNPEVVKKLCQRHFGIGADGLMLLENDSVAQFRMRYFNSDGNEATMCGNGGRCMVIFANKLGIIGKQTQFTGVDGLHEAEILNNSTVRLKMINVDNLEIDDDYYIINTGSPHYVQFVEDVKKVDVDNQGRIIRNSIASHAEGVNVNFAQFTPEGIRVSTYERGVEAETLACGTGAVATAIAANHWFNDNKNAYTIFARGGELKVSFDRVDEEKYHNIWLEGPVVHVFDGVLEI